MNPFKSGLARDVVLRLLTCKNKPDPKDRAKYEKTEWFQELREKAIQLYKSCVLCGVKKNLQLHHRNYLRLFNEDLHEDVTILCARHHSSFHRKR